MKVGFHRHGRWIFLLGGFMLNMNRFNWAALAVVSLCGLSGQAQAHVDYADLSDPISSPGGVNGGTFTNFGWHNGTEAVLGDSHSLAGGTFFKFHLDQSSLVTITFSDISGTDALNPAFSLYSGLFAAEAHDDTTVDPLNPKVLVSTPTPHVVKLASPVDNGVLSPFRDTEHVEYRGQFDALDSWSMANNSGEWAVIQYLTHVGPAGGNSVSLVNYLLGAGDYTIAAGGGTVYDAATALEGLDGQISLSVTAVPLPAAVWLFAPVLAGLTATARKRNSAKG